VAPSTILLTMSLEMLQALLLGRILQFVSSICIERPSNSSVVDSGAGSISDSMM
jgi:hypothetical protein